MSQMSDLQPDGRQKYAGWPDNKRPIEGTG